MCVYGYLDTREAEVIFASPKINKSVLSGITPCMEDMQKLLDDLNFQFKFRIIANDDFNDKVLRPILKVSNGVSDTNELFVRGYHMLQMFDGKSDICLSGKTNNDDLYGELKVGKLAQLVMKPILESGIIPDEEIIMLQDKDYCSRNLGISFPLLVKDNVNYDRARYYKEPVIINSVKYAMCSQWAESKNNNDRPYLMKWIKDHQG